MMVPIESIDPVKRSWSVYDDIAEEYALWGLDPNEIARSIADCTRYSSGHAWLKTRAYKPTGVAIGCPLPDAEIQIELNGICQRMDQRLRSIVGTIRPTFAMVPADWFHITLVNFDHFDSKEVGAPIRRLSASQFKMVRQVVSETACGPVEIELDGLVLNRGGRLLVKGHALDARIFQLKEALRSKLPFLQTNFSIMTHIKLGHVVVTLNKHQSGELSEWLAHEGGQLKRMLRFEDVYTPTGRINL